MNSVKSHLGKKINVYLLGIQFVMPLNYLKIGKFWRRTSFLLSYDPYFVSLLRGEYSSKPQYATYTVQPNKEENRFYFAASGINSFEIFVLLLVGLSTSCLDILVEENRKINLDNTSFLMILAFTAPLCEYSEDLRLQ